MPTVSDLRTAVFDRELARYDGLILDYLTADRDSPRRRRLGGLIADMIEAFACRLDQSPGLRAIGFLSDPEALYAEAGLWRAGQHDGSGATFLRCAI